MSGALKKSIKNNGITKVNKKERKFTDKFGRVLLNNFLLTLLQTRRSYQSTHPLHKHEQHLHSEFFVLVVMNFMTEIFRTVDLD